MCKAVGCDGVLGSGLVVDKCGVCGGSSTACQIFSGTLSKETMTVGYHTVITIPAGAMYVNVTELTRTRNYLALAVSGGESVFNMNWKIDYPRNYSAAGTNVMYTRSARSQSNVGEQILIMGPTTVDLDVKMIYQERNPGIFYEYVIPNPPSEKEEQPPPVAREEVETGRGHRRPTQAPTTTTRRTTTRATTTPPTTTPPTTTRRTTTMPTTPPPPPPPSSTNAPLPEASGKGEGGDKDMSISSGVLPGMGMGEKEQPQGYAGVMHTDTTTELSESQSQGQSRGGSRNGNGPDGSSALGGSDPSRVSPTGQGGRGTAGLEQQTQTQILREGSQTGSGGQNPGGSVSLQRGREASNGRGTPSRTGGAGTDTTSGRTSSEPFFGYYPYGYNPPETRVPDMDTIPPVSGNTQASQSSQNRPSGSNPSNPQATPVSTRPRPYNPNPSNERVTTNGQTGSQTPRTGTTAQSNADSNRDTPTPGIPDSSRTYPGPNSRYPSQGDVDQSRPDRIPGRETPVRGQRQGQTGQGFNPVLGRDTPVSSQGQDQTVSGFNPQTGARVNPQTGVWLNPQTGARFDPQTDAGFNPQTGARFNPQTDAGFNPQTGARFNPQTDAGFNPQTGARFNPQTDAGFNPQTGAGFNPQTGYGSEPTGEIVYNPNYRPPANHGQPSSGQGLPPYRQGGSTSGGLPPYRQGLPTNGRGTPSTTGQNEGLPNQGEGVPPQSRPDSSNPFRPNQGGPTTGQSVPPQTRPDSRYPYRPNEGGLPDTSSQTTANLPQTSGQVGTFPYRRPQQQPGFGLPVEEENPEINYSPFVGGVSQPIVPVAGEEAYTSEDFSSSVDEEAQGNQANLGQIPVVPDPAIDQEAMYIWMETGYTECSVSCAGGIRETVVQCVSENSFYIAEDSMCDERYKPMSRRKTCNNGPCPPVWNTTEWSACSRTCGEGRQMRVVTCQHQVTQSITLPLSLDQCSGLPKPPTTQACNSHRACTSWRAGDWGPCNAECGEGVRRRELSCVDESLNVIAQSECDHIPRPDEARPCQAGPCTTAWFTSDWSTQCSTECGSGTLSRGVVCSTEGLSGAVPEDECSGEEKPQAEKACSQAPCGPRWFTTDWGKCSVTCGTGTQARDAVCLSSGPSPRVLPSYQCPSPRPPTTQPCEETEECAAVDWYTSPWSECSQTCGGGHRRRSVKCLDARLQPNSDCQSTTRPSAREPCNIQQCNTVESRVDPSCTDSLSYCDMILQARLCKYTYYRQKCCRSCSK